AWHLMAEHLPGRYTFHDLLRCYAAERAARDEPAADCAAARHRLYSYYLKSVDAAMTLLKPSAPRLPRDWADERVEPARVADRPGALAWLESERSNLVAAGMAAADHGPRPAAWLLANALHGYFRLDVPN